MDTNGTSALVPVEAKLFGKMARVMGIINRVPKSGNNTFHKYRYATADDVADVIREAMAEVNLALIVQMGEVRQDTIEYESSQKTTKTIRTTIHFNFIFACGDTGATISAPWTAQVDDNSDKAINKAATAAEKYFLMKTFIVSAGDEPDSDSDKHTPEPARKVIPMRWQDDTQTINELVSRACNAGYIADCTLAALLALLKKDSLNDYATLADAANAVKEAGEARKAAQASLRHYTIITDKAHIAMDETVTFETEHGKLEIKRSELLYKLETSGNATDRLNGRQQAEQMQLDHWGHTSSLGHNREFKNARLIIEYDVYINGATRLSITSVRPETDWLNKVPPPPKPTPEKIDLNRIPE